MADVRRALEELLAKPAGILEGSVRRAGNRIRVTAQLINAADGYHLWSERYDGEMADVFAVQDEIATAITNALEVKQPIGRNAPLPIGIRRSSTFSLMRLHCGRASAGRTSRRC